MSTSSFYDLNQRSGPLTCSDYGTNITTPGVSKTQRKRPKAPDLVRLYMLDCGKITNVGATEFGFEDGEIATEMFTPCYLIVHPKGTLMWDTGEIPDSELADNGSPTTQRSYTVTKPLLTQLAAIGYMPVDIDYLALSHYHNDHVANANLFAESTWLVQRAEHEVMFAAKPDTKRNGPILPNRKFFGALENSKTKIIENKDHDVFGDGKVIIKFTPGHTPGHQSLFLRLYKAGPLLITGDLYHFYEEVNRAADFVNHASNERTTASRTEIENFVKTERAQLWIPHDAGHSATIKKAPDYYD